MMIKTLIAAALVAGAMPSVDAGTLQWMKANQYTNGRGGESGCCRFFVFANGLASEAFAVCVRPLVAAVSSSKSAPFPP